MPDDYTIGRLRGERALVFWRGGKRHRHTLGTSDPGEAARLAPALYAELTRPRGKSVKVLWDAYCREKTGRAIMVTMIHTWKALAARFGTMAGDAITVADCQGHIDERRAADIGDGTIHTELGHLRMVLVWAVKRELLARAPYIERPVKPRPKEFHLTRAQARRLINGCELPHLKLSVILLLGTAGRVAAVLGLVWDRCDFEAGVIDLRDPEMTAPHKGRAIVPMNRTVRAALQEARQGALSGYVVEWAGEGVGSVRKGLAAAAQRAGLPKVSPHVLRHTAAVHMAEAGTPMEEIAQYLGHDDVAVTRKVYARFSPSYLRGAAAALEYDDIRFNEPKNTTQIQAKSLANMVGATGIEPVTPTMSTLGASRKLRKINAS